MRGKRVGERGRYDGEESDGKGRIIFLGGGGIIGGGEDCMSGWLIFLVLGV
jgi:hypothetical protein